MKARWAFGSLAICLGLLAQVQAADPVVQVRQTYPVYPQQNQPCPPPPGWMPGGPPRYMPGGVPAIPAMPGMQPAQPSQPGAVQPQQPGTTQPQQPSTTQPQQPGAQPNAADQSQNQNLNQPQMDQGQNQGDNGFSQAPLAGTGGGGSNPNMIGDLGAGSYICGIVSFRESITRDVIVTLPSTGTNGGTRTVRVPQTIVRVSTRKTLIPQVGRGAFKIADNESPRPLDRVFINYNYFDNVFIPGAPGFNLNRETIGFEKTFLGGDASIGMRLNFLQSTGNDDGSLNTSDFGDMTIITKYAFINDRSTGNVLSGGLAVTAPTGPDAVMPDGTVLHPTLLQPYTGYIYNLGRLYAQGFSSIIVPSNSADVTLLSLSNGVAYRAYQAPDTSDAFLRFIVPSLEGHATIALNHRGLDSGNVGFADLFVVTSGIHIGLGDSSDITAALAIPLTGPQPYDIEAVVQYNYRFGASRNRPAGGYTPTLVGSY